MMKLYVVQHAHALDREQDPQRPLSKTGRTQVLKMTAFIKIHARFSVDVIFHSGKLRALQTADLLAEALKPAGGIMASDGLEPNDDPQLWISRISSETRNLMLVGHRPHLDRLITTLTTCRDDEPGIVIRNSAIACLEQTDPEKWRLCWYVIPEILK